MIYCNIFISGKHSSHDCDKVEVMSGFFTMTGIKSISIVLFD